MAIVFPLGSDGDTYVASNGIIYEFSDGAWRLSAGNVKAGVHIGTTPPNNPQAGDLWWHSGEADLKIYYIDPSSEQWVPASSPPDPYEENFVSVTGDTMTGRLNIVKEGFRLNKEDGDRHFTISQNENDYYTNIWSHNCKPSENSRNKSGGLRIRVADNNGTSPYTTHWISEHATHTVGSEELAARTGIFFLQTPTKNHHAANKQYVDDAVSAISSTTKVPGRKYRYSTANANSLNNGYFTVDSKGKLYMSRYDRDGIELATTYRNDWASGVKFTVTVRDSGGSVKHAYTTDHWYQGVDDRNYHIKYNVQTLIKDGHNNLSSGTDYYISDGIYCIN